MLNGSKERSMKTQFVRDAMYRIIEEIDFIRNGSSQSFS